MKRRPFTVKSDKKWKEVEVEVVGLMDPVGKGAKTDNHFNVLIWQNPFL